MKFLFTKIKIAGGGCEFKSSIMNFSFISKSKKLNFSNLTFKFYYNVSLNRYIKSF